MSAALKKVIQEEVYECRGLLSRIKEALWEHPEFTGADFRKIGIVLELANCGARLAELADVPSVHKAYGAPGDFGYDTPTGEALSELYSAYSAQQAAVAASVAAARAALGMDEP